MRDQCLYEQKHTLKIKRTIQIIDVTSFDTSCAHKAHTITLSAVGLLQCILLPGNHFIYYSV